MFYSITKHTNQNPCSHRVEHIALAHARALHVRPGPQRFSNINDALLLFVYNQLITNNQEVLKWELKLCLLKLPTARPLRT